MWSLYQSLEESSPMRFHVYYSLVQLAGKTDQIRFTSISLLIYIFTCQVIFFSQLDHWFSVMTLFLWPCVKNRAWDGLILVKKLQSLKKLWSEVTVILPDVRWELFHEINTHINAYSAIFTDVETVKSQFNACPPSNEQMLKLLRLLHEVLLQSKKSEEASAVRIMLSLYYFLI